MGRTETESLPDGLQRRERRLTAAYLTIAGVMFDLSIFVAYTAGMFAGSGMTVPAIISIVLAFGYAYQAGRILFKFIGGNNE